jgi:hypothetical protein
MVDEEKKPEKEDEKELKRTALASVLVGLCHNMRVVADTDNFEAIVCSTTCFLCGSLFIEKGVRIGMASNFAGWVRRGSVKVIDHVEDLLNEKKD